MVDTYYYAVCTWLEEDTENLKEEGTYELSLERQGVIQEKQHGRPMDSLTPAESKQRQRQEPILLNI